jgi:hypothetical protein
MANRRERPKTAVKADASVAATLTGIIYQAKLFNRQARVNVPEEKLVAEVLGLWRTVMGALSSAPKSEVNS